MSMVKIVSPSGWDFGEPTASLIKISSRGLIGNDRRDFLKRAGDAANIFLPYLETIKIAADEVPVHLIGLGAKERWGANRNGDGFSVQTCRDHHDTFVKFARFYRNHANKVPQKSYGRIKLSAYNESMHRVELLTALNATKEAAERNDGLIADREIEKLGRGEDLGVSMACSVPHDVCSACQHQARTRDEYCTQETCKAGGCRDNLARLVKLGDDAHYLHVMNPSPRWFDMSDVYRPADYTAYGHRADYLTKAAADHGFFGEGGAKQAQDLGVTAPLDVVLFEIDDPRLSDCVKLAYAMDGLARTPALRPPVEASLAFVGRRPVDVGALDADTPAKTAAVLGALAERQIVLPLVEFARLTKRADHADAAHLDGVFGRMIGDGSLVVRLGRSHYATKAASERQRAAAERLDRDYALTPDAIGDRAMRAALSGIAAPGFVSGNKKSASASREAEELARDYACYQVTALERIARAGGDLLLTAQYAATQNQVI